MMDKDWYKSVTIWGGILMILAIVLGQFGFSITTEEQVELAQQMANIATGVSGVVGLIMVIIGRRKAGKEIRTLKLMKGVPLSKKQGAGFPGFFIEIFEKFFGSEANAVMSGAMFLISPDGRELFDSVKKAIKSERGKVLIEQLMKLGGQEINGPAEDATLNK